jgi:hypothetical protein
MFVREVLERVGKKAPASVMLRGLLEHVFKPERLDEMFENTAERQSNKTLLFSSVAQIMGLVALRILPSISAGYRVMKDELGVTIKALYDKLQRLEPCVSRKMVCDTAGQFAQILGKMKAVRPQPLAKRRVKIIDGNHLAHTDRRIGALRPLNVAPLPGHCLVVLDPQLRLMTDVFPCEDGHASERSLLPEVLKTVEKGDLITCDRNFATVGFLQGIMKKKAEFVIRQHGGSIRHRLVGTRRKVGRIETGIVYEQELLLLDKDEQVIASLRRVTVKLDTPTRDGDVEIHILTNLPKKIKATRVAELYRSRWSIESAFKEMATNFRGEIETLGYPKAALFAFCMALVAYNLLSVIQQAMKTAQPIEQELSTYYLCDEILHTHRGLDLILDHDEWTAFFAPLTASQMAKWLLSIARNAQLERYYKNVRGPKKKPPKMNKRKRGHASTARILAGTG